MNLRIKKTKNPMVFDSPACSKSYNQVNAMLLFSLRELYELCKKRQKDFPKCDGSVGDGAWQNTEREENLSKENCITVGKMATR